MLRTMTRWTGVAGIVGLSALLIGCAGGGAFHLTSPHLKFRVQVAERTSEGQYLVMMLNFDGTCVREEIEESRLAEVLGKRDDIRNETLYQRILQCSSQWETPSRPDESTKEVHVTGPKNKQYQVHAAVADLRVNRQVVSINHVEFIIPAVAEDLETYQGEIRFTMDTSQASFSTAKVEHTFMRFRLTDLDMASTPGWAEGEFECLARDAEDPKNRRLLIVMDGSFALEAIKR